jgi:hypothetical protein
MKKIVLVGLLLILAGCIGEHQKEPVKIADDSVLRENLLPATEADPNFREYRVFEQFAKEHKISIEETKKIFKKNYNIQKESDIFAKLPKPNELFAEDRNKLFFGTGFDLETISYQNYLQPEFYLNFTTIGIEKWVKNNGKKEKITGIAATPADQQVIMEKEQTGFHTNIFAGGTWGANYYQGFKLTYEIIPEADINVVFSPNETIVGPAFPAFDPQWVKRIRINGKVGEKVPKGNYIIKIDTGPADTKTQISWSQKFTPYTGANELIKNKDGIATLQIQIK